MGVDLPPPPAYEQLVGVPVLPDAQPPAYNSDLPPAHGSGLAVNGLLQEISLQEGKPSAPQYVRQVSDEQRRQYLATLDLPPGIANEILQSCKLFPLRIWVIDNSGSMGTSDGHKLVRGPAGNEGLQTCSRWGELGDAILWHATLAANLGAPTEFRLLNAPPMAAKDCLGRPRTLQHLVCGIGEPADEIAQVQEMLRTDPFGRTPLCEQLNQVVDRVKEEEARLRTQGLRALVVVASDGQATDGSISEAIRPFRDLPVCTVIRLCTDEDSVAEYWNSVDEDLELDLDVLDDLCGEAREVAQGNPWLTYGTSLHCLREWGTARKVLDTLDEAPLNEAQMIEMVKLIAGNDVQLPSARDWPAFEAAIKQVNAKLGLVWDPLRSRKRPWFSVSKLKKRYSGRARCTIS